MDHMQGPRFQKGDGEKCDYTCPTRPIPHYTCAVSCRAKDRGGGKGGGGGPPFFSPIHTRQARRSILHGVLLYPQRSGNSGRSEGQGRFVGLLNGRGNGLEDSFTGKSWRSPRGGNPAGVSKPPTTPARGIISFYEGATPAIQTSTVLTERGGLLRRERGPAGGMLQRKVKGCLRGSAAFEGGRLALLTFVIPRISTMARHICRVLCVCVAASARPDGLVQERGKITKTATRDC